MVVKAGQRVAPVSRSLKCEMTAFIILLIFKEISYGNTSNTRS